MISQHANAITLGDAAGFAILTETGVTDVYPSVITGNVGASPITGAAILLSCPEVTGTIYEVNKAGPSCAVVDPSFLTSAVASMQSAYTVISGMGPPTAKNLAAGLIGGKTITPGIYSWSSAVLISSDLTFKGSSTDIWVLQIA